MSSTSIPERWRTLALAEFIDRPEMLANSLRSAGVPFGQLAPPLWRLKPGPAAIATLFEAGQGASGWPLGYLLAIDASRLESTLEKALALHPIASSQSPGVVQIPELGALFFAFPNDRHLRALKLVVDRDKLKRLLSDLPGLEGRRVRGRKTAMSPVRYKPERRFLMRAELEHVGPAADDPRRESLFLRFFTDDRGARIDRILRNLGGGSGPHAPAPYGTILDGQLQVEGALPGEPATAALLADRLDPDSVARLLLALRGADALVLEPILTATLLRETTTMLDMLGGAGVASAGEIDGTEARLLAIAPDGTGGRFVHGDLHLGQCLLSEEHLQIIDFERSGRGDPSQDLGNLLATLQAWRLGEPSLSPKILAFEERLLATCMREGLTRESLPFFRARALLELATLPIRRLKPEWPSLARALFLAAQASLP